jgi:hypothetical protein
VSFEEVIKNTAYPIRLAIAANRGGRRETSAGSIENPHFHGQT